MNVLTSLITQIVNKEEEAAKATDEIRKKSRQERDREWHRQRALTLTEEQKQVLRDRRKECYKRYKAKLLSRKAGTII
jgi:hypothetical protein